jgi:tetratricopeptide (TPR) repeat protein
LNRAELQMALRRYPLAFADYERAIAVAPDDVAILCAAAESMAMSPEPTALTLARARTLASQAVECDPNNGRCWRAAGIADFRSGRWSEAIEWISKLVTSDDRGGGALERFILCMAYWHLGDRDTALVWWERAATRMAKISQPSNVGQIGRYDELMELYMEAGALLGMKTDVSAAP